MEGTSWMDRGGVRGLQVHLLPIPAQPGLAPFLNVQTAENWSSNGPRAGIGLLKRYPRLKYL